MPKVFVTQGLKEQKAFSLTRPYSSVGRSTECDIVLPFPAVSRLHASIVEEDGGYYLNDLNSRNGTWLNSSRVWSRQLLENGDLIQIDEVLLRFHLSEVDAPEEFTAPVSSPAQHDTDHHIVATLDVGSDLRLAENAEHKLEAILELSKNIGVSLDVSAVLPRVLDSLLEIFPKADRASIVLSADGEHLMPYAVKSRLPDEEDSPTMGPMSRTVIQRALSEKIAVLSSDIFEDGGFERSDSMVELDVRSVICAPLIGPSKRAVGVLMAEVEGAEDPWDKQDLDVLVMVARMAAHNIDYVRLHQRFMNERQKAEETLQKSNVTLQTLINSSPLALFLVDNSGRVTRTWNPAAQNLFGWTLEEVVDQPLKMIASEDRGRIQKYWQRVRSGKSFTAVEIRCHTKSGEPIDAELSAAPLPSGVSGEGPVSEVLFIAADVTELKKTREEMLRKERLAAIGETMASLSHESRNAIYQIQMGIELLGQSADSPADVARVVGHLRDACKDLHYLYEDVRQYSGPIRLKKGHADLIEIVKRTWHKLAEVRGSREPTLNIQPQTHDSSCSVDAVRMEQVFRNLFENSLGACGDPLRIDVTLVDVNDETGIQITVGDNGPGLNSEQRRRIFEPFYTTKTAGTGLGMAIVKRIVEAHGGQITVDEEPSQGARFTIRLPRTG